MADTGATQLDDFPDELREVVHEHWGNYPPQHPLIKDAFGLLFGMLFIVAFFGNTCVIYVFLGTKSLRTPVSTRESKISGLVWNKYLKQLRYIQFHFSQTSLWSTWLFPTFACTPHRRCHSSSTLFTHLSGYMGHWGAKYMASLEESLVIQDDRYKL